MAFYEDFSDKVTRFKSTAQIRQGIAKIRRDEDRLFSLDEGSEREHRSQYLQLSRQALLLQALIEAESKPSMHRELARELRPENLGPLIELAPDAERPRIERVFRRVGHSRPHAAFIWHGAQLLMASVAMIALLVMSAPLLRVLGLGLLAGSLVWAGVEFAQARKARLEAREVYRLLQDHARGRLRLMRRMHEEIPLYY